MLWWVRELGFVGLGAIFGFCGGVFGIGGATLGIPTLALAFGMNQQLAQGTALVMALPNVAIGLRRYMQRTAVDVRSAFLISLIALPFAFGGALVATSLPSRTLRIAFAIFLILIGLDIGRRAIWTTLAPRASTLPKPYLFVVGGVCGTISGLFSIGGAIVIVPALTVFFGFSQLAAQGMSLAYSMTTAFLTMLTYASKGDVDWAVALPLTIGGTLAIRYGVDLAHRLPERTLRIAFMCFAIAVGISLMADTRG